MMIRKLSLLLLLSVGLYVTACSSDDTDVTSTGSSSSDAIGADTASSDDTASSIDDTVGSRSDTQVLDDTGVEDTGVEDTGVEDTGTPDTGEVQGEPGLTAAEIGDDTIFVIGSYDIVGDELEDGIDGPPSAATMATFQLYATLIPATYREGVVTFVAIDQALSGGTDGALQDVIGADGQPNGERYIALDVSGNSSELERTIVHETGHLIFFEAGGTPTAYLTAFNSEFPPGAPYAVGDFVTEYAASSDDGGEDIAESWAMYVFAGTEFAGDADDDGELDTVPEDTLAADKVAFFADYPELVQLKADILEGAF